MANTSAVNPASNSSELDFSIRNGGSIFLLYPHTETAPAWIDEHVGEDNGYQPYWPTVVIEARYVEQIIVGLQTDGLTVRL